MVIKQELMIPAEAERARATAAEIEYKRELARESLKEADSYVAFAVGESLEEAKRRIVELEGLLEASRSNTAAAIATTGRAIENWQKTQARITKLEAALTDALYAWGLFSVFIEGELSSSTQKDYQEAEARIQKARAALPKVEVGK